MVGRQVRPVQRHVHHHGAHDHLHPRHLDPRAVAGRRRGLRSPLRLHVRQLRGPHPGRGGAAVAHGRAGPAAGDKLPRRVRRRLVRESHRRSAADGGERLVHRSAALRGLDDGGGDFLLRPGPVGAIEQFACSGVKTLRERHMERVRL